MPKISVIMPAYNAEKYIAEAIDSILGQTFTDFELIILNDHSSDRTEEIILSYKDPRIVYVKNEQNLGVAGTLNRGLDMAKGEYIARMDADDISLPERFAKQAALLDECPRIAVVGCSIELFDDGGTFERRYFSTNPDQMKVDMFFSSGLAHPSVMMRTSMIRELGDYDRNFEGLEDYELWCRVSEKYSVTTLPELLFRYRVHGGQVTKNPSPKYQARMETLRKRQLEQLGLPEVLKCRIWRKDPSKTKEEILDQAAAFQAVLAADQTAGQYDMQLLEKAFRGVLLGPAAELSSADRKAVCEATPLLDRFSLNRYRFVRKIKRLLGR